MGVRLLIDGYNLLHHSQLLGTDRGPNWLRRARDRLIRHVAELMDPTERLQTQFVFDAGRRQRSGLQDSFFGEMEIRYASEYREADDLIESIIRRHPQPKLLTVVSSDHRLQRCARARRAAAVDSDVWLRQLERRRQFQTPTSSPPALGEEEKPEATAEHVESLLRKLGYAPSTPASPQPSAADSTASPTRDEHSAHPSEAKPSRARGRWREDCQRANLPVDAEIPELDLRLLDD